MSYLMTVDWHLFMIETKGLGIHVYIMSTCHTLQIQVLYSLPCISQSRLTSCKIKACEYRDMGIFGLSDPYAPSMY